MLNNRLDDIRFFDIPMPGTDVPLEPSGTLVILGANGSGKTRLGRWLEDSLPIELVHRISAQKSLSFPGRLQQTDLKLALNQLRFGTGAGPEDPQIKYNKLAGRWAHNPDTSQLGDFQYLFDALVSQDFTGISEQKEKQGDVKSFHTKPTILDKLRVIWQYLLPHRRISIAMGGVTVSKTGNESDIYNASQMSDGERVIFYMIGQCLIAPERGVMIIDEPELHINASIKARLWDAIQAARPDCLFIYLTHDIDFALSRLGATTIWLKAYNGGSDWDWQIVPEDEGIPQEVMLQIVGSRKPILFTEGQKGGLDHYLYSHVYPEYTVIPCGGCDDVIRAQAAFKAHKPIIGLDSKGLIDRDFRTDDEINLLEKKGVYVLKVGEVENLFLSEEVLLAVMTRLQSSGFLADAVDTVRQINNHIFEKIKSERSKIICVAVAMRLEKRVRGFNNKPNNKTELDASVTALKEMIGGYQEEYDNFAREIDRILREQDYAAALRIYTNKALLAEISILANMNRKQIDNVFRNQIAKTEDTGVLQAFLNQLPSI